MLTAAFILGFAGSFHCVAMCGALTLALNQKSLNTASFLAGKAVYNLGRTFIYSVLGLLLGASKLVFGAMLFDIHGAQEWLSISIGAAMLVSVLLPKSLQGKISATPVIARFLGKLRKQMGALLSLKNMNAQFLLGMVNGLLPCGFVYMALAVAALSGTVQDATLSMMLFGLGTIPAMLGVSVLARFSSNSFRIFSHTNYLVPVVTAAIAVLCILRGLSLGIPYLSPELSVKPAGIEAGCHIQTK